MNILVHVFWWPKALNSLRIDVVEELSGECLAGYKKQFKYRIITLM